LWDVKQTGLAGDAIGLKIGWSDTAVRRHIREHGGVRPRWGRQLSGRPLSMSERESILALKGQYSVREIARRLGRSPSTISRELRRDFGVNGYRATRAHALAFELARRPKEV
jgi:DNA-binding CsgD family transcriptional regulator